MALRDWLGSLIVFSMLNVGLAPADETANSSRPQAAKSEQGAKSASPAEEESRLGAALASKNFAGVHYIDTQLGDVAADLEATHGIDIEFDFAALTADGKGSETLINCELKERGLASLLHRILHPVGLTWTIADDDVIVITTPEGEMNYPLTKVYSVADFADADGSVDYDELAAMIKQAVDPNSWDEAADRRPAISRVSAKKALVITQTNRNHQAIAAILKQFRTK